MKKNLSILRDKLEIINDKFFKLLSERKELVREISLSKDSGVVFLEQFPNYAPAREWELYNRSLIVLQQLSLGELLAFSLLIEEHAGGGIGKYPAWSKMVHIESMDVTLAKISMINPMLVALLYPKELGQLKIARLFKEIIENVKGELCPL